MTEIGCDPRIRRSRPTRRPRNLRRPLPEPAPSTACNSAYGNPASYRPRRNRGAFSWSGAVGARGHRRSCRRPPLTACCTTPRRGDRHSRGTGVRHSQREQVSDTPRISKPISRLAKNVARKAEKRGRRKRRHERDTKRRTRTDVIPSGRLLSDLRAKRRTGRGA